MIWYSCFAISLIAICLSAVIYLIRHRLKKKKFRTALKTLIAGFAVGLFALFLPIQLSAFEAGSSGIGKAVLVSLNRTLRAFALTDVSFMSPDCGVPAELYAAYSFFMSLVCFICPLLTVGYILSFFSKVRVGARLLMTRRKNLYVFSQLNEESVALARDLSVHHPERRIVFCGVSDSVKAQNDLLVTQAEEFDAICTEKDMLSLSFRFHDKKKDLWFFAIGDLEQQNTNNALELLDRYCGREHTRIYLFSSLPESHMILSAVDPGAVKIRRIDTTRCTIYQFLYHRGEVLFHSSVDHGDGVRTISAVIVGLDDYGKELLKALSWYCQMDGYRLIIDAFDRDPKAQEHLAAECPELLDPAYNGVHMDGEAEYLIRIHAGTDVHSTAFSQQLKAIGTPTFAFVSTGNDSGNIELSAELRTCFERLGITPGIYTVLRSDDKKRMVEDIRNFKQQKYNIHAFGNIESLFSEKEIINSELEQEALELHRMWGDEASFWRFEYNYQSSLARAIHLKARRAIAAKGDSVDPKITEHKRWNAYMRSLGYVYSGSPDASSRNDLAKTHNDLIPYHQLSEEEKQKDRDLTTQE